MSTATPPPPPAPPPPPPPPAGWTGGQPGTGYYTQQPGTSGFAVTALVVGLGQICTWPITSILAIVFGNIALDRIAQSNGQLKGRGMAIAGIVLGWIGVAFLGALAVAWLVYGITNL